MVKHQSQQTQKRRSNLDHQLAQRLYENALINSSMEQMSTCFAMQSSSSNISAGKLEIHPNSSKGSLCIHVIPDDHSAYYSSGKMKLPHTALAYITDSYATEMYPDADGDLTIDYYSEIRKDGTVYRAHSDQAEWTMDGLGHD